MHISREVADTVQTQSTTAYGRILFTKDTYYIIKQFDKEILKMLFDFDKKALGLGLLRDKKLI